GWLDAKLFLQKFSQSFVLLLDGVTVSLTGMCAHNHAVHVLAERVVAQDLLGKMQRTGPVLRLLRDSRERLKKTQVLVTIKGALLFNPVVIAPLHELAAIERDRSFIKA